MFDLDALDRVIGKCLPKERVDPDNLPDRVKIIDVFAFKVAVDLDRAATHRDELIGLLADWPTEAWGRPIPRLEEGPNYLQAGAVLDDQRRALVLFAVGEGLGFWTVITPATFGITGSEAAEFAGLGFIMIDGYHPVAE